MEYLVLLRGINVGRNNRITMAELRAAFASARFTNVRTYINSGNVMLTSTQPTDVVQERSQAVVREWGLNVPVSTFVASELLDVLAAAPEWWTTPAAGSISNAIFVCPPFSPTKVLSAMGAADDGEQSQVDGPIIFVTSKMAKFMDTRWARIPAAISPQITVRNAQTTLKLGELLAERV